MLVSAIIGIVLGALSALRRGKWPDTVATMLANIGITAPGFWVAIILMFIFGLKLRWLPPFGYTSPFTDFGMFTRQAIMPIICLAIFYRRSNPPDALRYAEVMRQTISAPPGLKAQGAGHRYPAHAENALSRLLLCGMQLRQVFSGAVIIETVFNIPGMGRLSVDALFSRDFIIVQDVVLIISAIVILSNLFVDVAYGIIDPRIRYG
jgi:peptide/nickel transport system permease protein